MDNDYTARKRELFYYAIRGSGDIDLVIQIQKKTKSSPDRVIAVDFKLGTEWRSEWAKTLLILDENPKITKVERMVIVYTGRHRETHDRIELMPVYEFLHELHEGLLF